MITLTEEQFLRICPKNGRLAQCEWFRNTYGCTLEIKHTNRHKCFYHLTFKTDKEETFFRLQYSDSISFKSKSNPWDELAEALNSWKRQ